MAALPPARTLDVACGTGFLTRCLRGEVCGLDASEGMIGGLTANVNGGWVGVGSIAAGRRGSSHPLPNAQVKLGGRR